jgi:hypothetical protein
MSYIFIYIYIKSKGIYQPENLMSNYTINKYDENSLTTLSGIVIKT